MNILIDSNNKMKKLRVALYKRVSKSETSTHWVSTIAQQNDMLEFLKRHDDKYIIDESKHIYEDNWFSWAVTRRPDLDNLMKSAKAWEFDIVMVWKIDRFFRKNKHLLDYIEKLSNYNVWFLSLNENINIEWSFWKAMLSMMWTIAELERNTIRDRTMAWRRTKAEQWYYVWWNKPKIGYSVYHDWNWNKLKVNQDEKLIILRIFDLYVNERKSLYEISNILKNEWVEIRSNPKTKDDSRKKNFWHPTTISRILQNNMFIWEYYYWRTGIKYDKITDKKITYEKDRNEWLISECPILIEDRSLFDKAQEFIIKNKFTKNNAKPHTFAWLIKCKQCWRNYTWYKTIKQTVSYKCLWTRKKHISNWVLCTNNQISELILINYAWDKIEKLFRNPKDVLKAYYDADMENNNIIKNLLQEDNELNKNIKIHEKWLNNIYEEYYLSNEWKRKALDKIIITYENKIKSFKNRIKEVWNRIENFNNIHNNKTDLIKLANTYKNSFNSLDSEDKKKILKEFIERIDIDWKKINILFKFSVQKANKTWKKKKNIKGKLINCSNRQNENLSSNSNEVTGSTILNIN